MQLICCIFLLFFSFQSASFLVVCRASECKSKVAYTITVSQSGTGNFTTIADAVNAIPSGNDHWIKIALSPGTYKEEIHINQDKSCIIIEGEDRSTTTITSDGDAYQASTGTTFTVLADNFVAKGITFQNSSLPRKNTSSIQAFKAHGDKHAFYSCGFKGYQDTLLDDYGRHYFESCYITGIVDFIWGNGQSIYKKCDIEILGDGSITAQGRGSSSDTSGYLFKNCNISGTGLTILGRPYGAFSRVIYMYSYFGNVIRPEGWDIWHQGGHEKDLIFGEVYCKGPGSYISNRVPWLKKLRRSEIRKYTTKAFINRDGWIEKIPR